MIYTENDLLSLPFDDLVSICDSMNIEPSNLDHYRSAWVLAILSRQEAVYPNFGICTRIQLICAEIEESLRDIDSLIETINLAEQVNERTMVDDKWVTDAYRYWDKSDKNSTYEDN